MRMCRLCGEPLDPQDALDHPERLRALAYLRLQRAVSGGFALLAVLVGVLAIMC